MAFPVEQAAISDLASRPSGTTDLVVDLPASIVSGELLLLFVAGNQSGGQLGTPTGWTLLDAQNADGSQWLHVFRRTADGGEGATVSIPASTSGAAVASSWALRISGWNNVEISLGVSNTTSSVDPDGLTPSWGALDTRWYAVGLGQGSTNTPVFSASPTNYGAIQDNSQNTTDLVSLGYAARNLNASTEDPGAFSTTNAVAAWAAFTVGVALVTIIETRSAVAGSIAGTASAVTKVAARGASTAALTGDSGDVSFLATRQAASSAIGAATGDLTAFVKSPAAVSAVSAQTAAATVFKHRGVNHHPNLFDDFSEVIVDEQGEPVRLFVPMPAFLYSGVASDASIGQGRTAVAGTISGGASEVTALSRASSVAGAVAGQGSTATVFSQQPANVGALGSVGSAITLRQVRDASAAALSGSYSAITLRAVRSAANGAVSGEQLDVTALAQTTPTVAVDAWVQSSATKRVQRGAAAGAQGGSGSAVTFAQGRSAVAGAQSGADSEVTALAKSTPVSSSVVGIGSEATAFARSPATSGAISTTDAPTALRRVRNAVASAIGAVASGVAFGAARSAVAGSISGNQSALTLQHRRAAEASALAGNESAVTARQVREASAGSIGATEADATALVRSGAAAGTIPGTTGPTTALHASAPATGALGGQTGPTTQVHFRDAAAGSVVGSASGVTLRSVRQVVVSAVAGVASDITLRAARVAAAVGLSGVASALTKLAYIPAPPPRTILIEDSPRVFRVFSGQRRTQLGHVLQGPNDTVEYTVDWTDWVHAELTIDNVAWDVSPAGATVVATELDGALAKITLSTIAASALHSVRCRVTSDSDGNPEIVDDKTFLVEGRSPVIPRKAMDKDGKLSWTFEWCDWLGAHRNIASVQFTAATELGLYHSDHNANNATAWLDPTALTGVYRLTCRITTDDAVPQVVERSVDIQLIDE